MASLSLAFKVISERNCPFYEGDDWFVLTGQSVQMSSGHPACLILVRELTNILFSLPPDDDGEYASLRETVYTCGGCTGLIKFQLGELPQELTSNSAGDEKPDQEKSRDAVATTGRRGGSVLNGSLEEISPSELLQFFHMHQKTGKLMLHVPEGTGRVAFREGAIIGARFEEKDNKEAIFAILGAKSGRFSFVSGIPPALMVVEDIGDFMMILMEGIKRLDEIGGEQE